MRNSVLLRLILMCFLQNILCHAKITQEERNLISSLEKIGNSVIGTVNKLQSESGIIQDRGSFFHQLMLFTKPDSVSVKKLRCAEIALIIAKKMLKKKILRVKWSGLRFKRRRLMRRLMKWYRRQCPEEPIPVCDETQRYASADGSCNNLKHPLWGKVDRNQLRFVDTDYDDGVDSPRMHGTDGTLLPHARVVSNSLFKAGDSTKFSEDMAVMHMAWGQFMIHDIVRTPAITGVYGSDLNCCGVNSESPHCFPLTIPTNDEFYESKRCMPFVRSLPGEPEDRIPGERQQINEITSYLDGSLVYGSTGTEMNMLREHEEGLMKVEGNNLLPRGSDSTCRLSDKVSNTEYCPKAGDGRANEAPNLCALHTTFVRYHNDIAVRLAEINPHWKDEKLFQETRKIITAILQHITYNEYLPLLLGQKIMEQYSLYSSKSSFDTVYDSNVDATVKNSFGAAAFRFGHSQIANNVAMLNYRYVRHFQTPLENTFNRPTLCLGHCGMNIADLLRWMSTDKSVEVDNEFESSIRNKLFLDHNGKSFDLPALNIQRGRDHGLPGYNKFRKICKLSIGTITDGGQWHLPDHSSSMTKILSTLYRHPDDIDLYPAGISENHVQDGKVGPTFACLLGLQFRDLKRGDRFWYENNFKTTGFTSDQVNEIKKVKLSKVICVSSGVTPIQEYAFKLPSSTNPRRSCHGLPKIDLQKWKTKGDTMGR